MACLTMTAMKAAHSSPWRRRRAAGRTLGALLGAILLGGLECPVYPDSPLFGGGRHRNTYRLEVGMYAGTADCTRFFQSRGRAPVLDQFTQAFELIVAEDGTVWRDGTAVEENAALDLTLGLFTLERTVTRVSSTESERVVNLRVEVAVQDDSQRPVLLAGEGTETYSHPDADHIQFDFVAQVTTADAAQEVMDMAFDCSATLDKQ